MKLRIFSTLLFLIMCWNHLSFAAQAQAASSASRPTAALTLAQALSRVFERNPELAVSELEIQAASARVLQAGMKPNPEVLVESEDLSLPEIGAGVFHYTESTLQVSQLLELGRKRALRIRAAEKDAVIATRGLEVTKAWLIAVTSQAFADVLAEQERVANQQELRRLAEQSHAAVVDRVAAGKVSPVEQTRAEVALAAARLEEEKHLRALTAAKDALAAMWGGSHLDFDLVQGNYEIPRASSGLSESCLENNPEMRVAAAVADSRDATLAVEVASRKPDLTVSAGFRRLSLDRESVLVAGVSMPIPIFDKKQGAIAEARARLEQSRTEEKAVEWRLRAALTQARHDHASALLEATTLKESALPAAKEAADATEEGYRLGKFDFLNVLDAQRTYAELQGRYIEAVASGLKAAIEIERLSGCDSQRVLSASAK